ncbi:hypothetical protein D3C80_1836300 [compost metagenome]
MLTGLDGIIAKPNSFPLHNMLCFQSKKTAQPKSLGCFTLNGQIYNAQHILEDHKHHCSNSDLFSGLQPSISVRYVKRPIIHT